MQNTKNSTYSLNLRIKNKKKKTKQKRKEIKNHGMYIRAIGVGTARIYVTATDGSKCNDYLNHGEACVLRTQMKKILKALLSGFF